MSQKPGGYKQNDGLTTQEHLERHAQQPDIYQNNEEFCIVMLDKAMDPEGGILIKPYHCADETTYQQFEQAYEKLIQNISAELAQTN